MMSSEIIISIFHFEITRSTLKSFLHQQYEFEILLHWLHMLINFIRLIAFPKDPS